MISEPHQPLVSIVLLNYNGKPWMHRCLESIRGQTIFNQLELLIADNASTDGSDALSEELIKGWPNAVFIQNGANIGFGAGSNLAVQRATGKYLFFLNPDVWLEPNCLEQLCRTAEESRVGVAGLLVMDYDDNAVQTRGGMGFDLCGMAVPPRSGSIPHVLFAACGFYFISAELFRRIGAFDDVFFLYGEETDLSWRVWISGEQIIHAPSARMHHRGAALTNPKGGTKIVEVRTSELKRFYANRNHLMVIFKNCRHVLLLLGLTYMLWMFVEGVIGALLMRRVSYFYKTVVAPIIDCWRLRAHILEQRRRTHAFRKRGDFWMLRFFTPRFARWEDIARILKLGLPKVDRSKLPEHPPPRGSATTKT